MSEYDWIERYDTQGDQLIALAAMCPCGLHVGCYACCHARHQALAMHNFAGVLREKLAANELVTAAEPKDDLPIPDAFVPVLTPVQKIQLGMEIDGESFD